MTALELLAYCNKAIKSGEMQATTEIMIAQPGDLRAWPTYGVKIISATPRDEGAEPRPILIVITNMSDEEDDEGPDSDSPDETGTEQ